MMSRFFPNNPMIQRKYIALIRRLYEPSYIDPEEKENNYPTNNLQWCTVRATKERKEKEIEKENQLALQQEKANNDELKNIAIDDEMIKEEKEKTNNYIENKTETKTEKEEENESNELFRKMIFSNMKFPIPLIPKKVGEKETITKEEEKNNNEHEENGKSTQIQFKLKRR